MSAPMGVNCFPLCQKKASVQEYMIIPVQESGEISGYDNRIVIGH